MNRESKEIKISVNNNNERYTIIIKAQRRIDKEMILTIIEISLVTSLNAKIRYYTQCTLNVCNNNFVVLQNCFDDSTATTVKLNSVIQITQASFRYKADRNQFVSSKPVDGTNFASVRQNTTYGSSNNTILRPCLPDAFTHFSVASRFARHRASCHALTRTERYKEERKQKKAKAQKEEGEPK